jgi:hypothetical protein
MKEGAKTGDFMSCFGDSDREFYMQELGLHISQDALRDHHFADLIHQKVK